MTAPFRVLRWSHLTDVKRVREVVQKWHDEGFGVTVGPIVKTRACACRMVEVWHAQECKAAP